MPERRRARQLRTLVDVLARQYQVTDEWWPGDSEFEIMLGALLVQRTQWPNAAASLARLRERELLVPESLCAASLRKLEGCVRPSGFYRLKARRVRGLARFVLSHGGIAALRTKSTETLRAGLLALEGIGEETADAILAFAFRRPVFVVDAYSVRWLSRIGFIDSERVHADAGQVRVQVERVIGRSSRRLRLAHAAIVEHCKQVCRARPLCSQCQVARGCRYPGL